MSTEPKVIRLERNGPKSTGMPEMECDPAGFQSSLPTQHLHVYFSDPEIGLNVGVWSTTAMQEAFGPYPGDEFIWVLEGEFKMLDGEGGSVNCPNNSCVAFRNAVPVSWKQEGYLKKFYITYLDPNAESPKIESADNGIQVLDPGVAMEVMGDTEPFELEGAVPIQKDHNIFTNDAENFFVGTWESGPMKSKMKPFPAHEFVRMLEGEVSITEENGTTQTFKKDDCFFVPKGTVCSWSIPVKVKKHYAILDAG